MQAKRISPTWAYVFFGCGVISALLGYWRLLEARGAPAPTLVRGLLVSGLMLAIYLAMTLRVVRDLRDAAPPRIQAQVLMGAGVGLFLVSVALGMR
jgi:hypothetical protein